MNTIVFLTSIVSLGLLLWGSVSRAQAEGLAQVTETRLANGLQVLMLPNSKAPVVSVQVWYKVGSGNEALGHSGLAHLTEHLMFRGTKKYGPKQFSRIVQKNGGQDNAFTGRDYTAYFENLASDRLAIALDLESDRMTGLLVDEEKFFTEKKVVQEERRLRIKDDPSASLFEEVMAAAFKSHPYKRPITGWMEDLESLNHSDFLSFYGKYYQPANATLIVAGDYDKGTLLPLIEKTFGRIPKGESLPPVTIKEPPQEAEKRVILRREAQLPFVVLAYHVPSFPHPDSFSLEVMSQILAGGKSSRLHEKIVYQEQKALDAGADYAFSSKDPFLFFLYAQAMPGQTPELIEERLVQELEDWEKTPPIPEELERAKNQIEAAFIFAQDSIFYQANLLGRYQTLGNWKDLNKFLPGIRAVQQSDLLRVYRTYFQGRNKTVGVLIPIKQAIGDRK
ncbi:MAG: insulinase family protein [Deltaproteobacteria bacterium]|nr:insulinase family protein [Deltaproteobacteria bacterium]